MKWSPNRREFLAAAGVGGPVAGLGNVSWDNATDAVPDHPLAPEAAVEWSVETDSEGSLLRKSEADSMLYVGTPTGVSGLSLDGTERWRRSIDGIDSDRPVEVYPGAGAVYAGSRDGLRALDADDGHTQWRYASEGGQDRVDVSLVGSETIFLYERGLTALATADGHERWRFEPDDPLWVTPRVADDSIFVGSIRGHLYALDAADGGVRWHADRSGDDAPRFWVAGSNDEAVFAWDSEGGELYGFDRADGSLRWRFAANEDPVGFTGAVRHDTVYLGDGPLLRAISTADGNERWRYDAGGTVARWPAFDGRTGYFGAVGGVHAVSLSDGTSQWQFATGSNTAAYVVAVDDGTAFVDSRQDAIYALDAGTGRLRWWFGYSDHPRWFPAVADGTAYFAAESGTVYAVSSPDSTPLYDAFRTAVSPPGIALGGLLASGLFARAYRRRKRAQAPPPDPEEFTDFELLEPLADYAESDCAEAYEALTPAGERVALKRLEDGAIPGETFVDAVEAWADLDYDGVLDVFEWGTDPAPWVATELPDATLAERADELTPDELVHAVADAAETVHRAHREGVVHGGLAPENVAFVGAEVRVGDWRLAAELRGGSDDFDAAEADPADSDIERLAAMVADLLASEQVGDELDTVLSRALADDPDDRYDSDDSDDRYDSALALADALRWAVRGD